MLERPQSREETVGEIGQERRRHRPDDFRPMLDDFEIRQVQEIGDVLDGQPVLIQARLRQLQPIGNTQGQFPQTTV